MATIIIKNSTGSGAIPSSLFQGELAINTKDGKLFYGSGSGNIVKEFTGSGNTVSASYALTSSFAANGGVTQLLAGPNITLSPTNGKGQVTVSSTAGGGGFNTATGSYGSFYDTTTQTNPVANIPRSMSFNTTDITNGVSISGSISPFNTYIKTENAGIYNIQFSAQVDKTDGGTDDIVIWLRKNGIDLTDTATTLTLPTNNSKVVAAWNWFVNSAANDYYQIIWYSADIDLRLLAEVAGGGHPGIPSVILTVNRVDQFLSNTGSFSGSFIGSHTGSFTGSFTGSLLGTASNALTASFLNTLNQNLTFNGNLTLNGTASISTLVINQTQYSSGSNQLGDAANDTQTLYGSVIIPTGSLVVTGSTTSTGGFTGSLFGTASWANNALTASFISTASTNAFVQGGNSFGAQALLGTNDNQSLAFETSGSVRMFISSSGRVGINTSTPRATTELVGTLRLTNTGDSSKFNDLATDLNGYMTIGNVVYTGGIGSNNGYVNLYQNYINVGSASGYFFTSTVNSGTSTRDVGFSRAGVNIVSVNTGAEGNANGTLLAANIGVGLGMTSPSARLQVRGSGATSSTTALRVENTNASASLVVLDNGNVGIGTTSPTGALHIVDAGTSATIPLQINQYIRFRGDGVMNWGIDMAQGRLSWDTGKVTMGGLAGNNLELHANGSSKIFVSSSGNVGIGTATPVFTLDVNGSGRFTNGLTVTGSLVATSFTGSLLGTASWATSASQAITASYVLNAISSSFATSASFASTASYVLNAVSSSFASTASFVATASWANSASNAINAQTASFLPVSTYNITSSWAVSASQAITASYVLNAISSSFASTASFVATSSWAINALTASFVNTASTNAFVQNGNSFGAQAVLGTNDDQSLAFETSGSVRMFISSSGNVGIGTNSPSKKLHLNVSSSDDGFILTKSGSANNIFRVTIDGTNDRGEMFLNNGATTIFAVRQSSNVSYINTGNNFGVGTTTPTAQLQVKGTGAAGGTTVLRTENSNASASLIVLDNGNVGIGITNPAYALQVSRSIWIQPTNNSDDGLHISNQGFLVFRDTANSITTRLRGITGSYQFQDAAYNIKSLISTNNNITYFNNGGGNVGIGLTSPAATLHISGASNSGLFEIDSPTVNNIFYVSGSGDIGIGTNTPISKFTIQTSGSVQAAQPIISVVSGSTFGGWLIYTGSSERVRYAWNTSDGAYVYTATTDPFTVFTNGTRALRIDSSQNVGIGTGTDTPSARVQVRGSGATSATTAFIVQNSTPTNIITVLNNGVVGINRTPTASLDVAGTTRLSGSFNTAASGSILTVIGSGSTQPIFTVQGSQGELFSVTDSLSGSLFSVNDISGLPILEVFSDNTTLIGDYQDPMLITTKKVTMTNSGSFVVYSLPTASYDTAFFDYSIKSGSNARAGQIMAIQSGSSVNFTETTTTDFGSTAAVSFTVLVSGSNMVLTGSAATGSWTIKTIVRGI